MTQYRSATLRQVETTGARLETLLVCKYGSSAVDFDAERRNAPE
jgi:hypothetical protein